MTELITEDDVARFTDFDNRARRDALAANRRSDETIPVVDFTAYTEGASIAERRKVAESLRATCTRTGFFYLINHGISAAEFGVAHAWGHVFFELPHEEKAKIHRSKHPVRQGWMHAGTGEYGSDAAKEFDQKETLQVSRELLPGEIPGDNPMVGNGFWPDPALMPGFREFTAAHIAKRVAIGQNLCRALALSLDLPEDYFDAAHRYPRSNLTYNYYPPLDPATVGETQWGISPHTDYGSFTLLSQDELGGLEVRNQREEWIDVPPVPGAFVINIADLMARWTNGVYRSSLHRASNFNTGKRARISLAMFFNPHPKTMIACVPTCRNPDNPPKYEPIEAGPYMNALVAQAYRSGRPGVTQTTAAERLKTR